jgi:hypothetical protein
MLELSGIALPRSAIVVCAGFILWVTSQVLDLAVIEASLRRCFHGEVHQNSVLWLTMKHAECNISHPDRFSTTAHSTTSEIWTLVQQVQEHSAAGCTWRTNAAIPHSVYASLPVEIGSQCLTPDVTTMHIPSLTVAGITVLTNINRIRDALITRYISEPFVEFKGNARSSPAAALGVLSQHIVSSTLLLWFHLSRSHQRTLPLSLDKCGSTLVESAIKTSLTPTFCVQSNETRESRINNLSRPQHLIQRPYSVCSLSDIVFVSLFVVYALCCLVTAKLMQHILTIGLVMIRIYKGSFKVPVHPATASQKCAPLFSRRRVISNCFYGSSLFGCQRKLQHSPTLGNVSWTSIFTLLPRQPLIKTHVSTVRSSASVSSKESWSAETAADRPKFDEVDFRFIFHVLRFSTVAKATLLIILMCVMQFPLVHADFCQRNELQEARLGLAAASLPSGLAFFAGGYRNSSALK